MPSPNQKFNILYCGSKSDDLISLAEYIESFYIEAGLTQVDVEIPKLIGVIGQIAQQFPSPLGPQRSSPFKKVAAFTTFFVAEKPIITPLTADFGELATHQNAIIAFALSIDALHGARIKRNGGGEEVILANRIAVSEHFWKDTISALSGTVPFQHFNCVSLIYESLAYQFNPDASYERVI